MDKIIIAVKEEQDINSIAKKYNTTVKQIMKENFLDTPSVVCGQRLVVTEKNGFTYRVKPFEDIFSVSLKFQISVEDLRSVNDLPKHGNVFVGQELFIPN